jgi:hypothetical protein
MRFGGWMGIVHLIERVAKFHNFNSLYTFFLFMYLMSLNVGHPCRQKQKQTYNGTANSEKQANTSTQKADAR